MSIDQDRFSGKTSIGLGHRINDYAESLPYGEHRKVEIARAMAMDAKLLLLDEPAAGMNPAERKEQLRFILILKEVGYTVLLIELDMRVVMNISDCIYALDHGKRIAEGKPEEIVNDVRVIRAYLGEEREASAEDWGGCTSPTARSMCSRASAWWSKKVRSSR